MNFQQFIQWAISQGQVGNPNQGETFKGQCVSFIQQLLSKVYGIPWTPRGNAKDWPFNDNVLSYFEKVDTPRAGDIGVMGENYGGGYGHIFIYTSPNTIIEQNGRVPLRISTGNAYSNPIAILRRKGSNPEGGGVIIQNGDNWFARLALLQKQVQGEGVPFTRNDFNWWIGKDTLTFIEALSDSKEAQKRFIAGNVGEVAVRDKWDKQIYTLQDQLKAANDKITELGSKPVPVPPTTIDQATKDQIAETNNIVKQIFDKIKGVFK